MLSMRPYGVRSILIFALGLLLILHLRYSLFDVVREESAQISSTITNAAHGRHPIEKLHDTYWAKYEKLLHSQSKTVSEAVERYKSRYERDPPVGFEAWVEYAIANEAVIIDDFDTIEKSLAPFRKLGPAKLKQRVESFQATAMHFETIKIHNGEMAHTEWALLANCLKPVLDKLGDVEFFVDWLDEPRVLGTEPRSDEIMWDDFSHKDPWDALTANCRETDIEQASTSKFVDDMDDSRSLCRHPEFQNMHGMLVCPSNFAVTRNLAPLFSPTRLSTMKDIIMPGLDYLNPEYLGGDDTNDKHAFSEKKNMMYWKGGSTGQYFKDHNWNRNHRIRFVQKFKNNTELFNVGMSNYVQCEQACDPMKEEIGVAGKDHPSVGFEYKFAMDMDGNGYSGRYYRLLMSNSLTFKQTLMDQWHDDRLLPWVHFVPVSMAMDELEDSIRFFAFDEKGKEIAERIADQSTKWGRAVLRPIDLTLYNYRLLLEYKQLFRE